MAERTVQVLLLPDVYERLRAAIKAAGSQRAFSAKHGLHQALVSYVINGHRQPPRSVLKALGLKRVVAYQEGETP